MDKIDNILYIKLTNSEIIKVDMLKNYPIDISKYKCLEAFLAEHMYVTKPVNYMGPSMNYMGPSMNVLIIKDVDGFTHHINTNAIVEYWTVGNLEPSK